MAPWHISPTPFLPPALESTMRQVNPPCPPFSLEGTGTWRRLLGRNCPRRFGRREKRGGAAGCGGWLGGGRRCGVPLGPAAGSGLSGAAGISGRRVALLRFGSCHFLLDPVPVPSAVWECPSLQGHGEVPGTGGRCCAFPFRTGCRCCKERVAASGCAGGVSFGAVSV